MLSVSGCWICSFDDEWMVAIDVLRVVNVVLLVLIDLLMVVNQLVVNGWSWMS
jgi:hypothetical protein